MNRSIIDEQHLAVCIAMLLGLVRSPAAWVRATAAHGLRPLGGEPVVQAALLPLLDDAEIPSYNALLSLFGRLSDPRVQEAFIEQLGTNELASFTRVTASPAKAPAPIPPHVRDALANRLGEQFGPKVEEFADMAYKTFLSWADRESGKSVGSTGLA